MLRSHYAPARPVALSETLQIGFATLSYRVLAARRAKHCSSRLRCDSAVSQRARATMSVPASQSRPIVERPLTSSRPEENNDESSVKKSPKGLLIKNDANPPKRAADALIIAPQPIEKCCSKERRTFQKRAATKSAAFLRWDADAKRERSS